jgi:hypothetical protein
MGDQPPVSSKVKDHAYCVGASPGGVRGASRVGANPAQPQPSLAVLWKHAMTLTSKWSGYVYGAGAVACAVAYGASLAIGPRARDTDDKGGGDKGAWR